MDANWAANTQNGEMRAVIVQMRRTGDYSLKTKKKRREKK
jgi:hypothetical protein